MKVQHIHKKSVHRIRLAISDMHTTQEKIKCIDRISTWPFVPGRNTDCMVVLIRPGVSHPHW